MPNLLLEKVAKKIMQTEFVDKFTKILEFIFRLLSDFYSEESSLKRLKFQTLSQSLREARQLFRFFKCLQTYSKILQFIFEAPEELLSVLHIASLSCFFIYEFLDNLSAAANVKLLRGIDSDKYEKISARFKIAGLILNLVVTFLARYWHSSTIHKTSHLKLLHIAVELLPTYKRGFNTKLSEKIASIGGLLSGCISFYQIQIE